MGTKFQIIVPWNIYREVELDYKILTQVRVYYEV